MHPQIFDVNTMIGNIAVFDQALSASATNMKVNFDTQIAGISQTFASTFQAIDATIATSAANFNLSFGTSHQFDAVPAVKMDAGSLNGALTFSATMLLQSDITVTNPA